MCVPSRWQLITEPSWFSASFTKFTYIRTSGIPAADDILSVGSRSRKTRHAWLFPVPAADEPHVGPCRSPRSVPRRPAAELSDPLSGVRVKLSDPDPGIRPNPCGAFHWLSVTGHATLSGNTREPSRGQCPETGRSRETGFCRQQDPASWVLAHCRRTCRSAIGYLVPTVRCASRGTDSLGRTCDELQALSVLSPSLCSSPNCIPSLPSPN